jgi:uncharacterized lipoprotein YddW (UPF0748 family)
MVSKTLTHILVALLLTASSSMTSEVIATKIVSSELRAPQTSEEVRGIWVVRTSLTTPASVASMVATAKRAGFNTLLVQVRGRGEAFYRSAIDPRASALDPRAPDFDPLALTIAEGHRAGLRVHAWVNGNLVASASALPVSRNHVVRRHPEWLMLPHALAKPLARTAPASPAYLAALARWTRGASEDVEGLFLSPVHPAARAYSVSVVRELAQHYNLDGVHLDYLRYPSAEFDYSASALAAFRAEHRNMVDAAERTHLDRAAAADPSAWTRALAPPWVRFRQERLTSLVEQMRDAIREVRPQAIVSAAVFPLPQEARINKLQDWPAWARSGWLDAVCPMIYTTDADQFSTSVVAVRESLGSVPFWAGIGAYRLSVARAAENVRAARRDGAAGVLLFSYDSLVTQTTTTSNYLDALRPVLLESGASAGSVRPGFIEGRSQVRRAPLPQ